MKVFLLVWLRESLVWLIVSFQTNKQQDEQEEKEEQEEQEESPRELVRHTRTHTQCSAGSVEEHETDQDRSDSIGTHGGGTVGCGLQQGNSINNYKFVKGDCSPTLVRTSQITLNTRDTNIH